MKKGPNLGSLIIITKESQLPFLVQGRGDQVGKGTGTDGLFFFQFIHLTLHFQLFLAKRQEIRKAPDCPQLTQSEYP